MENRKRVFFIGSEDESSVISSAYLWIDLVTSQIIGSHLNNRVLISQ